MKIIDASFNTFKTLFPRMKEEFPESEMKRIDQFEHFFATKLYHCFQIIDGNNTVGMALGYLNKDTSIFWLDYLQIFKEYQDKRYGRQFLNAFLYGDEENAPFVNKGIILEIEDVDSQDFKDNKVKRMRFYNRFNVAQIEVNYLFPCNDGTTIPLNLCFIPNVKVTHVSKSDLVTTLKGAVSVIHYDIPHAEKTMNSYIDGIKDLELFNFTCTDVDLSNKEELATIGELIYHVDPWVYPALFDGSIEMARKVGPYLIKNNTVYNHRFIKLGRINGEIAGFIVCLEHYVKENHEEMIKSMIEGNGSLTPKFNHVMEGYFDTLDYEWEGIQILSLSVLPKFRKLHVASKMIYSLSSEHTYTLACVRDNLAARKLYEKCGFEFKYDYPGYTGVPCVELIRKGK